MNNIVYPTIQKVVIEGSIGSGKSTILDYIHEKYSDFIIVPEPVDYWIKTGFFPKYNSDSKKYGFQFQLLALISRFMEYKKGFEKSMKTYYKVGPKKGKHPPVIIERSGAADYNCFMKYMKEHGELDDDQMYLLNLYYGNYFNAYNILDKDSTKFIILNTTPEICFERVKKRARVSEKLKITVDYLKELHDLHQINLVKDLKSRGFIENKSYFIINNDGKKEEVKKKIDEILSYLN